VEVRFPQDSGKEVPHTYVHVDPAIASLNAHAIINALQEGDPRIFCFERLAGEGTIVFMPEALKPGEAAIVSRRLRQILESAAS
jgi:hypothetical protein